MAASIVDCERYRFLSVDTIPSTIEPRIVGVAALGLARAESRFVRFHGRLPGNLPVRYLSKKENKNYSGAHFVLPALLHFLCNGGFLRPGTRVPRYLDRERTKQDSLLVEDEMSQMGEML